MKGQLQGHSGARMSYRGGNGDEKVVMGEVYIPRVDFTCGCVMDVGWEERWQRLWITVPIPNIGMDLEEWIAFSWQRG